VSGSDRSSCDRANAESTQILADAEVRTKRGWTIGAYRLGVLRGTVCRSAKPIDPRPSAPPPAN